MIDFCPSVVYWLSISLRYLQSVHTVRLQSLGVTKQIFRPTEFFPLTITETITDKSTQISIWLNIYLFPSDYRQPWCPGLALFSCVLQHYKQIVIVLIQSSHLHTWPGWVWVGGDRSDQTRYLTALTSSRSLIPSAPRSYNPSLA